MEKNKKTSVYKQCSLSPSHCCSFGYREKPLAQISSRDQQSRKIKDTLEIKLEIVLCAAFF